MYTDIIYNRLIPLNNRRMCVGVSFSFSECLHKFTYIYIYIYIYIYDIK